MILAHSALQDRHQMQITKLRGQTKKPYALAITPNRNPMIRQDRYRVEIYRFSRYRLMTARSSSLETSSSSSSN